MRILQQHLDFIEYEPIGKEISAAEDTRQEEAALRGDSRRSSSASRRATTTRSPRRRSRGPRTFLGKLKVNRIIIYPYAHLSQNLARPKDALEVLKTMERLAKEAGLETYSAPFGWNKAFQIKVKGHPLAEQSRVYTEAPRQRQRPRGGPRRSTRGSRSTS